MSNLARRSLIPQSVLALGNSVIRYVDARMNNNVLLPQMDDYGQDLFSYPWNQPYLNILRQILQARTVSGFYRCQFETLHKMLDAGNADFLRLLIKYGFLNIKVLEDYPFIKYDIADGRRDVRQASRICREYRCGTRENYYWTYEPSSHFAFLNNLQNYTCLSAKRLRKVLWGLGAINQTISGAPPYLKVQCLRTFYEFSREPYITNAEIEGIATFIKSHTQDSVMEQLLGAFEEHFPESRQGYRPRSLHHLCLCQIRECLVEAGMFPQGIKELRIPDVLKECVVPKEVSDSGENIPVFNYYDNYFSVSRHDNRFPPFPYSDWWERV